VKPVGDALLAGFARSLDPFAIGIEGRWFSGSGVIAGRAWDVGRGGRQRLLASPAGRAQQMPLVLGASQ